MGTLDSSTSRSRKAVSLRDSESLGYSGNNRCRSNSYSTAATAAVVGGAKLSSRPLPLSRRSRRQQHGSRDSVMEGQRSTERTGPRSNIAADQSLRRRSQSGCQRTPGDYDGEVKNLRRTEGGAIVGKGSTRGDYDGGNSGTNPGVDCDAEHSNHDNGDGYSPVGLAIHGGVCADGGRRRDCNSNNVSARQTEGQRAAAERLRAWQERRRRVEEGGGGEREAERKQKSRGVRRVRNYNIRDDSADVGR